MKVFTTHLDQNLMIKMINIKKQQQNNNTDTKPPNVFDYLKSWSEKAKDLMDEIEDADMTLTTINFFLLVVIRKILTLTLWECH